MNVWDVVGKVGVVLAVIASLAASAIGLLMIERVGEKGADIDSYFFTFSKGKILRDYKAYYPDGILLILFRICFAIACIGGLLYVFVKVALAS